MAKKENREEQEVPELINKMRVKHLGKSSNIDEIKNNFSNIDQAIAFLKNKRQESFNQSAINAMYKLNKSFAKIYPNDNSDESFVKSIQILDQISSLDLNSLKEMYQDMNASEQDDNGNDDMEHDENNFQ